MPVSYLKYFTQVMFAGEEWDEGRSRSLPRWLFIIATIVIIFIIAIIVIIAIIIIFIVVSVTLCMLMIR